MAFPDEKDWAAFQSACQEESAWNQSFERSLSMATTPNELAGLAVESFRRSFRQGHPHPTIRIPLGKWPGVQDGPPDNPGKLLRQRRAREGEFMAALLGKLDLQTVKVMCTGRDDGTIELRLLRKIPPDPQ